MNVLDTIDTTVTFEWGSTRTIGTLLQLGGRTALVTALRAPEAGTVVFLRIEGDSPQDSMALDGECTAVTDSEWGERQVEIEVQRVGTTASAAVLRDFIERHGLAKGGSVSVGRNRDNPDLKRFVYSLPAIDETAATPPVAFAGPATPRGGLDFAATRLDRPAGVGDPRIGPGDPAVLQIPRASKAQPTAPWPTPGRLAAEALAARPFPLEPHSPQVVDPTQDHDPSEQILVNTVDHDSAFAEPVFAVQAATAAPRPEPESSLVQRLFGRKSSSRVEPDRIASTSAQPRLAPAVTAPGSPARPPARSGHSGSMAAVQALFAVDHAVRAERPLQFDAAKKRRSGVLLRLGETKVRIRSAHVPQLYERIQVVLPAAAGQKDGALLQCEVIRVRGVEADGGEAAFDARITGGNSAQTMARVRDIMSELEPTRDQPNG